MINDFRNLSGLLLGLCCMVTVSALAVGSASAEDGLSTWSRVVSKELTDYSDVAGFAWRGVAYGNGTYVAVAGHSGSGSTSTIYTSPDGTSWTDRGPWEPTYFKGVKFLEGMFYAYGGRTLDGSYLETIWRSADGVSWTVVFSNASSSNVPNIKAVSYGNGIFLAGSNYSLWYSSDNLQSWNEITHSVGGPAIYFSDIAYGNGVFVATGHDVSTPKVYSSPDGINWTLREADSDGRGLPADFARFVNGHFVIGSSAGMKVSTDGSLWRDVLHGLGNAIAYGNGGYAFSNTASNFYGEVYYSTDLENDFARTIRRRNYPVDEALYDIAAGPGGFVAVGSPGIFFISAAAASSYPAITGDAVIDLQTGVAFEYSVEVRGFTPDAFRTNIGYARGAGQYELLGVDLPPGIERGNITYGVALSQQGPHLSGTPTTEGEWSVMLYAYEDGIGNDLYAKRKVVFRVTASQAAPTPDPEPQPHPDSFGVELAPATATGTPTRAAFRGGLRDSQGLLVTAASVTPSDQVDVVATIEVDPDHVGSQGGLLAVAAYEGVWFVKSAAVGWALWDGTPAGLLAHESRVLLDLETVLVQENVTAFGLFGTLDVFVGYRAPDGNIHFNATPISFNIAEDTTPPPSTGECTLDNISFARYSGMRTNGSQSFDDINVLIGCEGQLHEQTSSYSYYRWYLAGTGAYIQGGFHLPSGGGLYDVSIVGISSEDGRPYCSLAPGWSDCNPAR